MCYHPQRPLVIGYMLQQTTLILKCLPPALVDCVLYAVCCTTFMPCGKLNERRLMCEDAAALFPLQHYHVCRRL